MIETYRSGLKLSLLVLFSSYTGTRDALYDALGGRWARRQGGDLLLLSITEISHPARSRHAEQENLLCRTIINDAGGGV